MKRIWRRLLLLPSSVLLAACIFFAVAAIVLAVTVLFIIPAVMHIIPGPTEAEVYADANATIPIPQVNWGDVEHGQTVELDLYVKNTGVEPITANVTIDGDVSEFFTYTITPAAIPLEAGEIGHFVFEAYILPTAPLEDVNYGYKGTTP